MNFLFMKTIYKYSFIILLITMLPEVLMEQDLLSSENYFSNLKVFAIAAQSKAIQLKITWKLPIDKNTVYDVVLFSVKSNKSCSDTYCHEYDMTLENNYLSIPSHPISIIEHDWCKIQADCDYNITVKTLKPNLRINTMYHVPDCVENICSCHHAHLLPNTHFIVNSTGKELRIYWSLDPIHELPEYVYLVDINISIIELNSTNAADWGPHKPTEEVKITLNNFSEMKTSGVYTKTMNTALIGRKFSVRGRVIDSRGCHGKDGSKSIQFPTEKVLEKTNKLLEVLLFTFFGLLLSIIIIIILVLWKQRKSSLMQNWPRVTGSNHISRTFTPTIEMVLNPGYGEINETKMNDPFEIPHHAITSGRVIGVGAFGLVYIAKLEDQQLRIPFQIVAVKKLKKRPTTDQLEDFLGEIATLKKVGRHQNIVNLVGYCTVRQPLMMIMEYMGCGDLSHYLRKVRAKHEAKYARTNLNFSSVSTGLVKQSGSANFASVHNNSNSGSNSGSNMKRSASNSSNIGLHGKYLEILHSHSSTSTTDSSSYITQPESLPIALGGSNIVRNSFTETQYTNLSEYLENSVSAKLNALEYIVDHNELHNFAVQIARGMKHLEDKKITHRDLAARNILIDETKTLKISDFGLSRSGIYVNTRNKRVPLRWLSIEAMKDSLYSSKSDTWAYGIVLWEIGTLGGFPYPTVSNHELIGFLKRGERLERPDNCSEELYELMKQCWAERPEDRPTFKEIVDKLEPSKSKIYIDFDELGPAYVFPPTCEDIKTVKSKKENVS